MQIENNASDSPQKAGRAEVACPAELRTVGDLIAALRRVDPARFVMVLNEDAILDHPKLYADGQIIVLSPEKQKRGRYRFAERPT